MIGLTQITSVPRSEVNHKNEHILLQVSFNDTDDVNIIGTDGEAAYAIKLNKTEVESNCRSATENWFLTFRNIMLDQTDESEVDVSASCKESKITVLFRQKADIPLKIYSFDIPCTEDHELVLFDWAVQLAQSLKGDRVILRSREQTQMHANAATKLVEQDLQQVQARLELQERQLLEKFTLLLNSKKARIRELCGHESTLLTSEVKTSNDRNTKRAKLGQLLADPQSSKKPSQEQSGPSEEEIDGRQDGNSRTPLESESGDTDNEDDMADVRESEVDDDEEL